MARAQHLHEYMESFRKDRGTKRGALVYAIEKVFPGEKNSRSRYAVAAQMVKEFRQQQAES